MLADDAALTIVVRDWGSGIQPRPARREAPALGLGLPLIAALSDSFELKGSTNSGAEVRMTFIADRSADPAATQSRSPAPSDPTAAGTPKPKPSPSSPLSGLAQRLELAHAAEAAERA